MKITYISIFIFLGIMMKIVNKENLKKNFQSIMNKDNLKNNRIKRGYIA